MKKIALIVAMLMVAVSANAANLVVDADITTSTTWYKSDSPISLVDDIYVKNGASLTIEAGTVIASYVDSTGSLAITQGSKIYVNGTADEPVIMTSAEDVATWDGSVVVRSTDTGNVTEITTMGDSKTGAWRPVCNEWGSLAIMGQAYLSGSSYGNAASTWSDGTTTYTNTDCPSADNKKKMEGLDGVSGDDTRTLYGGNLDDDDSGEIHYLSLRYGGRDNLSDNKELNGLSLGAIGRATDIDHVEVMNNVDDGIEIWGGTVELSYVNIWNVGDDSFDVDEGWRGSLENGLIVQGYSRVKKQGSGMGDNAFETDGAEDSDAQPVTTAKISNVTVVGQPGADVVMYDEDLEEYDTVSCNGSDAGTAWRDNARVQYSNCAWINVDKLIQLDNADGDGSNGYNGYDTAAKKDDGKELGTDYRSESVDGTLSWYDHWQTSYTAWANGTSCISTALGNSPCNITDFATELAFLYDGYIKTDVSGNLCQITDSIYYDIASTGEMSDLDTNTVADFSTVTEATELPIQRLVRGETVTFEASDKWYVVRPVTYINPMPVAGVTAGGFGDVNWLGSWTATYAFGMTSSEGSADLNFDGSVDLADLAQMSSQWLQ